MPLTVDAVQENLQRVCAVLQSGDRDGQKAVVKNYVVELVADPDNQTIAGTMIDPAYPTSSDGKPDLQDPSSPICRQLVGHFDGTQTCNDFTARPERNDDPDADLGNGDVCQGLFLLQKLGTRFCRVQEIIIPSIRQPHRNSLRTESPYLRPFAARNSSGSVNALKNNGLPEKANGDTGPTAMNGNSLKSGRGKL